MTSFTIGFVFNSVFNLWITRTILKQRDQEHIRSEFSWKSFLMIHAILLGLGLALLGLLFKSLEFGAVPSFLTTVGLISFLSLFAGRIWVFVSPSAAMIEYEGLSEDFYESSTVSDQVGSFRAWYHVGRFQHTQEIVEHLYRDGMTIYDLGCGGSEWNKKGLPVIGIDLNELMLRYGQERNQL